MINMTGPILENNDTPEKKQEITEQKTNSKGSLSEFQSKFDLASSIVGIYLVLITTLFIAELFFTKTGDVVMGCEKLLGNIHDIVIIAIGYIFGKAKK